MRRIPEGAVEGAWVQTWHIQEIVLFLGLGARINSILCTPTPCLGTPPPPSSPTLCDVSPAPRYRNIYHTILAMAISCKGKIRTSRRRARDCGASCNKDQQVTHTTHDKNQEQSWRPTQNKVMRRIPEGAVESVGVQKSRWRARAEPPAKTKQS